MNIITIISAVVISASILVGGWINRPMDNENIEFGGPRVLIGSQGGTGLGSATAGEVGTCLKVSDDSPFAFELGSCGSGSGGSNWSFIPGQLVIRPSTTVGIIVSASSTFVGDFKIGGNSTNTGSMNIGSLTAASCDVLSDTNGLLYCGTNGGGDAFTHVPVFGQPTSATTTLIALTGSPFALAASTTVALTQASTTQVSISSLLYLDALAFDSLTDDATLENSGGDLKVSDVFLSNTGDTLGGSLDMSTFGLTNFFGTACTGNEFLQDIADDGAFTCTEATGSGGGDSFTHAAVFGQQTSATSTLLYLTGSPFSLAASGTTALTQASTTQLSISGLLYLDALGFDSLTDDATLENSGGDLKVSDVFLSNAGDTLGGNLDMSTFGLTSFFGTACTGNEFLQDIADDGAFTCTAATGGGGDAFTHSAAWGIAEVAATSTPVWFKGTPFALFASSTSVFDQVTTTQLTIGSLLNFGGDTFDELVGDGLVLTSGDLLFDCSDVASTGLQCSGEDLQLNATGDWTGTLDGFQGADLFAVAGDTMANGTSTESFQAAKFSTDGATYISNFAGDGLIVTANALLFDCSDVASTGLQCSGEDLQLNATGDWTGTLDSIDGANFLRSDTADTAAGLITFTGGWISNASSTHIGNLNIVGIATTTGLVIGTTVPPVNPIPTGDLFIGNKATSTVSFWVGSAGSQLFANSTGGDIFAQNDIEAGGGLFASGISTTTATTTISGESGGGGVKIYHIDGTTTLEFL